MWVLIQYSWTQISSPQIFHIIFVFFSIYSVEVNIFSLKSTKQLDHIDTLINGQRIKDISLNILCRLTTSQKKSLQMGDLATFVKNDSDA